MASSANEQAKSITQLTAEIQQLEDLISRTLDAKEAAIDRHTTVLLNEFMSKRAAINQEGKSRKSIEPEDVVKEWMAHETKKVEREYQSDIKKAKDLVSAEFKGKLANYNSQLSDKMAELTVLKKLKGGHVAREAQEPRAPMLGRIAHGASTQLLSIMHLRSDDNNDDSDAVDDDVKTKRFARRTAESSGSVGSESAILSRLPSFATPFRTHRTSISSGDEAASSKTIVSVARRAMSLLKTFNQHTSDSAEGPSLGNGTSSPASATPVYQLNQAPMSIVPGEVKNIESSNSRDSNLFPSSLQLPSINTTIKRLRTWSTDSGGNRKDRTRMSSGGTVKSTGIGDMRGAVTNSSTTADNGLQNTPILSKTEPDDPSSPERNIDEDIRIRSRSHSHNRKSRSQSSMEPSPSLPVDPSLPTSLDELNLLKESLENELSKFEAQKKKHSDAVISTLAASIDKYKDELEIKAEKSIEELAATSQFKSLSPAQQSIEVAKVMRERDSAFEKHVKAVKRDKKYAIRTISDDFDKQIERCTVRLAVVVQQIVSVKRNMLNSATSTHELPLTQIGKVSAAVTDSASSLRQPVAPITPPSGSPRIAPRSQDSPILTHRKTFQQVTPVMQSQPQPCVTLNTSSPAISSLFLSGPISPSPTVTQVANSISQLRNDYLRQQQFITQPSVTSSVGANDTPSGLDPLSAALQLKTIIETSPGGARSAALAKASAQLSLEDFNRMQQEQALELKRLQDLFRDETSESDDHYRYVTAPLQNNATLPGDYRNNQVSSILTLTPQQQKQFHEESSKLQQKAIVEAKELAINLEALEAQKRAARQQALDRELELQRQQQQREHDEILAFAVKLFQVRQKSSLRILQKSIQHWICRRRAHIEETNRIKMTLKVILIQKYVRMWIAQKRLKKLQRAFAKRKAAIQEKQAAKHRLRCIVRIQARVRVLLARSRAKRLAGEVIAEIQQHAHSVVCHVIRRWVQRRNLRKAKVERKLAKILDIALERRERCIEIARKRKFIAEKRARTARVHAEAVVPKGLSTRLLQDASRVLVRSEQVGGLSSMMTILSEIVPNPFSSRKTSELSIQAAIASEGTHRLEMLKQLRNKTNMPCAKGPMGTAEMVASVMAPPPVKSSTQARQMQVVRRATMAMKQVGHNSPVVNTPRSSIAE